MLHVLSNRRTRGAIELCNSCQAATFAVFASGHRLTAQASALCDIAPQQFLARATDRLSNQELTWWCEHEARLQLPTQQAIPVQLCCLKGSMHISSRGPGQVLDYTIALTLSEEHARHGVVLCKHICHDDRRSPELQEQLPCLT